MRAHPFPKTANVLSLFIACTTVTLGRATSSGGSTGGAVSWLHQSRVHFAEFDQKLSNRESTAAKRLSASHLVICSTRKINVSDHFLCPSSEHGSAKWVQTSILNHSTQRYHAAAIACANISGYKETLHDSPSYSILSSLEYHLKELSASTCREGHAASFWLFGQGSKVVHQPVCEPPIDWGECDYVQGASRISLQDVEQQTEGILSKQSEYKPERNSHVSAAKPTVSPKVESPTGFSVNHVQSVPAFRRAMLSFIQVNSKIEALATAGVGVKEIYAMVVDAIANMLPEIITQLISSLIKIPLVTLIGQLLSALLPDALVPNSQSTPNVPIVPGIDPIKPASTPPCKCSGGAGFSLLERWREKKLKQNGMDSENIGLVEKGESTNLDRVAAGCNCEKMPDESLLETDAKQGGHSTLNTGVIRAPTSGGGANGGPIAKIEPKVRDAVMDGLLANCMPELQERLAAKIIALWPVVKYSVYRGSVRGLSRSLTSSITQTLVSGLLDKLFHGMTKYGTRQLVGRMVPGLTHSLSATITHALSRSPRDDYYCHYCSLHKLYCQRCMRATVEEYEKDYYVSYYSTYFSAYYSAYYSTSIADHFSVGAGKPGHTL